MKRKAVNWNINEDGFTQAYFEQNKKQLWFPEEVPVSKDVKPWKLSLFRNKAYTNESLEDLHCLILFKVM